MTGTADDGGMVTMYQSYGTAADVSDRALELGNPDGAYRRYDALQLIGTRRFADDWQYQVSYTWSRSSGTAGNEYHTNATYSSMNPNGYGANPNARLAPPAPPVYDYSEFKALGSYRAPWLGGFTVAGVFRWHSGTNWNRVAQVTTPIFASFAAEPMGARRTPSLGSLDLRVEKTFRLQKGTTLGLYVDAFNVTNVGRATGFNASVRAVVRAGGGLDGPPQHAARDQGVVLTSSRTRAALTLAAGILVAACAAHARTNSAEPGGVSFAAHTIATGLTGGYQVVVTDLNRDGRPDVIALASDLTELRWYKNPRWEPHVLVTGVRDPINAAAFDVDGDGIPEIALAHGFSNVYAESAGIVSILEHDADPSGPGRGGTSTGCRPRTGCGSPTWTGRGRRCSSTARSSGRAPSRPTTAIRCRS